MKKISYKNAWLAVCALALFGFAGCAGNKAPAGAGTASVAPAATVSDTEFAKAQFASLTEGEATAENALDWENFKSSGVDVGKIYAGMKSEPEKAAFRKSFVEGFSKSFKSSGATAGDVSNWRVESESPAQTTVIGDATSGKKIVITVVKNGGEQKMSAMEIR